MFLVYLRTACGMYDIYMSVGLPFERGRGVEGITVSVKEQRYASLSRGGAKLTCGLRVRSRGGLGAELPGTAYREAALLPRGSQSI